MWFRHLDERLALRTIRLESLPAPRVGDGFIQFNLNFRFLLHEFSCLRFWPALHFALSTDNWFAKMFGFHRRSGVEKKSWILSDKVLTFF